MESATVNLIGILHERVAALHEAGNLDEAYHAANAAVNTAHQTLGTSMESVDAYVKCLGIRGDVLRSLGNLVDAKDDYLEGLDLLENRPDMEEMRGRLHSNLGEMSDSEGDPESAATHWLEAMECYTRHEPPLEMEISAVANNLGFLYRQAGNLAEAEGYFLRALEIAHSHYGQRHEQTATVSSNLGALYLATGLHEQAREMHMMALEARRDLLGEDHPDTAQSHNNLALALLSTGDRSWARRHFEKALTTLEALGLDYADDLDAVADNYCEFLRSEGEEQRADVIAGRVDQLLGRSAAG